jgi:transposase
MPTSVRVLKQFLIPFLLNCHALYGTLCHKKVMYQPLPAITEDLDTLQARLRSERDPHLRPRLHLLVLFKSGQVTTRRQAAVHLAVHRNTIALWLRTYRAGGLTALLTSKEPGAPSGQTRLPAAVFEQLQARLATASGLASSMAIQQWLRAAWGREVPYTTLHGIVRYQRKATLKRPRPSHAKKTRPRRLTLSSSAAAVSALLLP